MTFVKACKTGDVKPGEGKVILLEGEEIAIFNDGGNFYATDNACPHQKGPLGEECWTATW
jgi:nitrite reductase/ring-hydroxylating ferredoxin subunit